MKLTRYIESTIEMSGMMKINEFLDDDLSDIYKNYRYMHYEEKEGSGWLKE